MEMAGMRVMVVVDRSVDATRCGAHAMPNSLS